MIGKGQEMWRMTKEWKDKNSRGRQRVLRLKENEKAGVIKTLILCFIPQSPPCGTNAAATRGSH